MNIQYSLPLNLSQEPTYHLHLLKKGEHPHLRHTYSF